MASFRCYDNSDVIAFLIMTNFHLYLIKLWWQFFQMFVYGDVVMLRIGRYWPWKTVTVSSHLHMPVRPLLLHRMALVSFRLYVSEKFGQLARIFWANGLPPPLAKNSCTPMLPLSHFAPHPTECHEQTNTLQTNKPITIFKWTITIWLILFFLHTTFLISVIF